MHKMSAENRSLSDIAVDGVQLFGTPQKVGPFYHYNSFTIKTEGDKTVDFSLRKIYRVRTLGKIGFATLKMIFLNAKTSKCFARFILHHFPEDTKQGRIKWQHGEDELMSYSRSITIRCSRVLSWTSPGTDVYNAGTMQVKGSDMEEYKKDTISLVRLKRNEVTNGPGKYSAFAGNAKLNKELVLEATKLKYTKLSQDVESEAETKTYKGYNRKNRAASEEMKSQSSSKTLKQDDKVNKEQGSVEFAVRCSLINAEEHKESRCSKDGRSVDEENSEIDTFPAVRVVNFKDAKPAAATDQSYKKLKQILVKCRPSRSCRSVYGADRKRKLDLSTDNRSNQGLPTKKVKRDGNFPKKRKRDDVDELASNDSNCDGERECKVKILSYDEYMAYRTCRSGLMAGLVLKKEEVLAKNVLAADGNNKRVFFTRSSFSEKDIHRLLMFEKPIEKKCLFGKKRRTNAPQENILSKPRDIEFGSFKEDGWRQESEDMYFASVGYKIPVEEGAETMDYRLNYQGTNAIEESSCKSTRNGKYRRSGKIAA